MNGATPLAAVHSPSSFLIASSDIFFAFCAAIALMTAGSAAILRNAGNVASIFAVGSAGAALPAAAAASTAGGGTTAAEPLPSVGVGLGASLSVFLHPPANAMTTNHTVE